MKQQYGRFEYRKNYSCQSGWDAFALDYSTLLQPDTVYTLTKEVMYAIVQKYVSLQEGMHVLDVNCGTGNDFPYFLSKGCAVSGCDVSTGMLNKAYETYRNQIESKRIHLFQGELEQLQPDSFEAESFDFIYSVTGGFSYIDHAEMVRVFKCLSRFLKPGGKIITAHFGRFCISESIYYLSRLRFKDALVRRKSTIPVRIKNQEYLMYLQKHRQLEKLFQHDFNVEGIHPLLFRTPPYQTKFKPGLKRLNRLRKIELRCINRKYLSDFSDQFVIVLSKK